MFIDKCLDGSERKTGPIPTPHIRAGKEEIAPVVLMPGDPLRARFIAESFLDNPVCVNTIRNMLCFTGECNGKPITVILRCKQDHTHRLCRGGGRGPDDRRRDSRHGGLHGL